MKKITKKEFKNTIIKNKSVFLGSYFSMNENKLNELINQIKDIDSIEFTEKDIRTVKKENSNNIVFSNDSYLYFQSYANYYELNNNYYLIIEKDMRNVMIYYIINK